MKSVIFILFLIGFSNCLGQEKEYLGLVAEGDELVEQGKTAEAIAKYVEASHKDSLGIEAAYGLGVAYFDQCKTQGINCSECLIKLDAVINKNSMYYRARYFRGSARALVKDIEGALVDFNKAIEQEPNNGYIYYNRAFINTVLKKTEQACLDLNKSCELGFPEACDKREQLCGN